MRCAAVYSITVRFYRLLLNDDFYVQHDRLIWRERALSQRHGQRPAVTGMLPDKPTEPEAPFLFSFPVIQTFL